ncbi:MAG: DUF2971 domain-containing protein [Afipia sp.]|nr:DUF2971 domain-containing protein [Afipia sp.]
MNAEVTIPGITADQLRLHQIFFPYAFQKTIAAIQKKSRFVHYTSAETAVRIFQDQEVWMRKSSFMNDFMEIEYGIELLSANYKSGRDKIGDIFDKMFPGFLEKLEGRFNGWLPHFRTDTYIACLSEHDDGEDRLGRLSMWRAYGGATGVAIVLNGAPMVAATDALKAYTSPVAYLNAGKFETEFQRLLSSVAQNADFVKAKGEDVALANMFAAFRAAILCTKHPGFHEEREWRVIYSPSFQKSDRLIADLKTIRGVPQPICRIPLRDAPEENLVGIELPSFIERVIIGPTQFPEAIREAFVSMLSDAGMSDANSRVFISDIPLRT